MWASSAFLIFTLAIALQLDLGVAQLTNKTMSLEQMLDLYEPLSSDPNRIVGGNAITIAQVPWQVALYDGGSFICGGSIISKNWVLTAAHCLEGGGRFKIRAGSGYRNKSGQIRTATKVYMNSKYNDITDNHDIGLIRVNSPFTWTTKVKAVNLAKPSRSLPSRYFVSGWGSRTEDGSSPNRLRGVTVKNVKRSVCDRKYSVDNITITRQMICAASLNKDSCYGDSGGALVNGNIQYGIVSFGIGCARAAYPGVYTNLRRKYSWIKGVIQNRGGEYPTWV